MKRTLWKSSCALLAIAFIAGLTPASSRLFAADDIVVEENITYGKGGDVDLKLDLARPKEGAGPFPAIVFIHGGGWSGGERQGYRGGMIETAAKKGYVAVTITYRLTQPDAETKVAKYPFPAQIHDCKCAVRWLRSVADKYHIDKDRIGVTGASAGGHLSLLVGLTDDKAGLEGDGGHADQSSRVQAVVNVYGPTDLPAAYDVPRVRDLLKALCGGTPESAAENYKAASPVTYISKDDPPVLTLHGDQDGIVLVSQATLLDAAMKKGGARHELLILKDQHHGFTGEAAKQALDATWAFFDRELKSSGKSK